MASVVNREQSVREKSTSPKVEDVRQVHSPTHSVGSGSGRSERSGSGLDILLDGISRGSGGSLVRESAERGSSD